MYRELFDLTGRRAFVTGGAGAIGAACAEALAEAGAEVIVGVHRDGGSSQIRIGDRNFPAVTMDVTDSAAVDAVVAELTDQQPIDILVNSAGIARADTRAEDVPDELWLNVLDVNLNGLFWASRAFGREMLKRGRGSIVNIGSISGFVVNGPQAQAYYNASKGAVHQLTKSLAVEWAPRGVRVNAVAPTYIETPLTSYGDAAGGGMKQAWIDDTPMARLGQPEEVASVALFLASDAASLVTGTVVLADGGYTAW